MTRAAPPAEAPASTPTPKKPEVPHQLTSLPVILDRAVSREGDRFGHKDFADALNLLICNEHNVPPFSIGLLGQWGTGKSSIEEMSIESLRFRKDKHGRLQEDPRFKIIRFNAWRYGGENLKRALLREVFLELSPSRKQGEDRLREAIKTEYTFTGVAESDPWADLRPVLERAGVLLACVTGITAGIAILWASALWLRNPSGIGWLHHFATSFTQLPSLSILGLGAFGIALFTQLRFMLPPYRTMSEKRSAKSIEETIESSLEELIQEHLEQRQQRVVVFVDDLDRLSADEMVTSLDAIRNFMDIKVRQQSDSPAHPSHAGFSGLVFVISCDEKRIAEALEKRRHKASDMPAVVLNAQDARRFLDRVFQYRLEIPPFPKQDMRAFIREKLDVEADNGGLSDLKHSLQEFQVDLESVVERLIQYDVTNPRAALQVVNSFAQSWWVAVRREAADRVQQTGALKQGVVTRHAEVLAVLSALRVLHPTFHQELQQTPQLLRNFIDVLVDQDTDKADTNFKRLPPKDRRVLQTYLKRAPSSEDSDKRTAIEIDEKYLPLLESIAWRNTGLHLPEDLEPLLLLSQDLTERGNSRSIRELGQSLFSRAGFLEALGVRGDARLTESNLRRVRQLMEDRVNTQEMAPQERRRAYETLTSPQFLGAMPNDSVSVQLVINPLGQGLYGQQELRRHVGPGPTLAIAKRATNSYQRDLLGVLAAELLTDRTPVAFSVRDTDQPISRETAIQSIQTLVPLLMEGNVLESTTKHLESWLKRLNVGDDDDLVDVELLREWYRAKPDFFRGDVGQTYTGHLTEALGDGILSDEDVLTEAMNELETIWGAELVSGTGDRKPIIRQMTKLLALHDGEVVLKAVGISKRLRHLLQPHERRELVQALGKHVVAKRSSTSTSQFECELRSAFIDQLETEDATSEPGANRVSSDSVIIALKHWPTDAASAAAFERLAAYSLMSRREELHNAVMTMMVDIERPEFIPEAFGFIGRHLDQLDAEVSTKATEMLQQDLSANPPINLEQIEALLTGAGMHGVKTHFSEEARTILPNLAERYAGQPGYGRHQPSVIQSLIPIIVALAPAAPAEADTLFNRIAMGFSNTPEVLEKLMETADRRWFGEMSVPTTQAIMNQVISRMSNVPTSVSTLTEPLIRLAQTPIDVQARRTAEAELAQLGLRLWPSEKAAALKLLQAAGDQVSPEEIISLLQGVNVDDEIQRQKLAAAWRSLLQKRSGEVQIAALTTLLTQRPYASTYMPEFITSLLTVLPNARSAAEATLPTANSADFNDLWGAVLKQPGSINTEWLVTQVVQLICNGQNIEALQGHRDQLFSLLNTSMKQKLVKDLQIEAFQEEVPEPSAKLAASWMRQIDSRSLNLNNYRGQIKERVRSINSQLKPQ